MRSCTTESGFEGPGRPCRGCRGADGPASRRRHSPAIAGTIECTTSRPLLTLAYLLVVAVSCVRSAPLPGRVSHVQSVEEAILSEGLAVLEREDSSRDEVDARERRAVRTSGRWTNATIPFEFDINSLTLVQRNRVLKAMKVWQKKTCVRFVERTDEEYFVRVYRHDASCHAEVGMKQLKPFRNVGQPLQLSLTYCLMAEHRGKIVHELGHVLGLYHEHQRPDRDSYVEIIWKNMIQSSVIREQYDIISWAADLGSAYDYHSIMHYGPTDNSVNGQPTMAILDPAFQGTIRNRTRPSQSDYRQVNLFYTCPEINIKDMDKADKRPDMLPNNAGDIRSGDRISLSPELNDTNTTWWLNCTDGCRISDAAGKKFKTEDVYNCTELIFELHKVAGVVTSMYIKVGDTVALKQRSADGLETVSCVSDNGRYCGYTSPCDSNGAGCESYTFVVGALGKSEGEQISHKDQLIFNIYTAESDVTMMSWMRCNDESIEGGACTKAADCLLKNDFNSLETDSTECKEPFTFLVTKL